MIHNGTKEPLSCENNNILREEIGIIERNETSEDFNYIDVHKEKQSQWYYGDRNR